MPLQTNPTESRRSRAPIDLFIAFVTSVCALYGAALLFDASTLRFGERGQAVAQVTDLNQPRRGQTVKYRFQPDGSPQWYTHVDFLGREVAAKVMKDAWLQAQSTGTITVVYNKSRPRLNLPVAAAPIEG